MMSGRDYMMSGRDYMMSGRDYSDHVCASITQPILNICFYLDNFNV